MEKYCTGSKLFGRATLQLVGAGAAGLTTCRWRCLPNVRRCTPYSANAATGFGCRYPRFWCPYHLPARGMPVYLCCSLAWTVARAKVKLEDQIWMQCFVFGEDRSKCRDLAIAAYILVSDQFTVLKYIPTLDYALVLVPPAP